MKILKLFIVLIGALNQLIAQPNSKVVEADLRRTFSGVLSIQVGRGSIKTEMEQGVWVTSCRVPVTVITETTMKNVQREYRGAAVYTVSGNQYLFRKYNPATGKYIGLPALNEQQVLNWILQNYPKTPELFLPMRGQEIAVHEISIEPESQTWNTMISVSLRAWITYSWVNGYSLFKTRKPYELRLFRQTASDSVWKQLAWIPATVSNGDQRKEEVLETITLTVAQRQQLRNLLQTAHSH